MSKIILQVLLLVESALNELTIGSGSKVSLETETDRQRQNTRTNVFAKKETIKPLFLSFEHVRFVL